MYKKLMLALAAMLFLSACSAQDDNEQIPPLEITEVVGGGKNEYLIKLPFKTSPLRQVYAQNYREIDVMEMGRGLQERSKSVFDPSKYYLAEGTLIDQTRYNQLIYKRESEDNIYGLNPADPITIDNVVIEKPVFVSDIVELNFHKSKDSATLNGVSFALVLKRIQTIDRDTGATLRLEDSVLYEIGVTLAQKLHSYIRTLEGASDIPIYIGLYVQESDEDRLPGNYLPGYFIGQSVFESSRNGKFEKIEDRWILLNSDVALKTVPDLYASNSEFTRNLKRFMGDENVGIVGKVYVGSKGVQQIVYEINTGSKTYLELHGLAESLKAQLSLFDSHTFPINAKIQVFTTTRITVNKEAGKEAVIKEFN